MVKILILNNFFNDNYDQLPKFLKKFLKNYNQIKLKYLINSLNKNNKFNVKITVINAKNDSAKIDLNQFFSDFLINLDRNEYLSIQEKIVRGTKQNLIKLFKNLNNLKIFHYKGISIGNALELFLLLFFNKIFNHYEILKKLLEKENYTKIILFNCNRNSLDIFRKSDLNQYNFEIYNDSFLVKTHKTLKLICISRNIFQMIGLFIKRKLLQKKRKNSESKIRMNVVFHANSKNHFESVAPVYDQLINDREINPIYYSNEIFLPFGEIINLLRFLLQKRKFLKINHNKISKNLKYESIQLKNVLKIFYDSHIYYRLITLFNGLNNLIRFYKENLPKLFIITNDLVLMGRITINYLKIKNIPTVYIPHAGHPIMNEIVTKNELSYIAAPGERDRDYFLDLGKKFNKIIITGRPRYDIFYLGKIKQLNEVKDMFNNRVYRFESNKFTILLTTNQINNRASEILISGVVHSLKSLNLLNNLIIKIHPRENGLNYKKNLQKLNVDPIIVRDYNILELIKSSNLLLSRSSTTILEAMVVGIPLFILDFINVNLVFTSKYLFMEEELLITIKDQKELAEKIRELMTNKEFYTKYSEKINAFSKNFSFYDEKETSSEKIINLIRIIIKNL